jgi:2-dehydro-3-deoxy-D-gluconate 5-dehydrogenase
MFWRGVSRPSEEHSRRAFTQCASRPKRHFMILDAFKLDGKVALVTGAGRGLGQAMALALAEVGADIAGLDRTGCGKTCEAVRALGRRYYETILDLREASVTDLNEVVERIMNELGRIDILVNNAGTIRRTPAINFSEADWDDVLHINLKAGFFLSQAVARVMMSQGGGKIIHTASMLSFQGGINVPAYTAAKSGLAGITRALANEWAKHNINVNAIAPGYIATDNTAALRADPIRSTSILERIPAGRWGTPDDLKGVAVLLASSASDYMHGAIIPVDGGWLAR